MKRFTATFLVLLLLFGGARPVSATAPTPDYYREGIDHISVVLNEGDCPIIVEHELLTFDLQDFPQNYYQSEDEFLAYSGKVTSQYTLYNPTDMTATAKLLLQPLNQPGYGVHGDHWGTQKYDILVNGETVEANVRHSLANQQFYLNSDLNLVSDTYVEDSSFHPDMTVTAYQFTVSKLDSERYKDAVAAFDLPHELGSRWFNLENTVDYHKIDDDTTLRLVTNAKNEQDFCLYVLGEPLTEMPEWKFYMDRSTNVTLQIDGTATLMSTETSTFKELVLRNWSEDIGISKFDWYNATIAYINAHEFSQVYPAVLYPDKPNIFTNHLMRWYEYEITLEPGQKIVNTITAPIYPSIDENYKPTVYGYNHIFSSEKRWQSFGKLDIVINTPYFITASTHSDFEKTDTGYKLTLDTLPDYNLAFNLSTSENPERIESEGINWAWIVLLAAPFLLIAEAFEAIGEFFTNLFQNLF